MIARIALCVFAFTVYTVHAEVDIITEPRPGEEYVLVTSGQQTPLRNFETSHKIPEKHPQHHKLKSDDNIDKITKKLNSGKVKHPAEGIVAIEEDKKATFKKGQKIKTTESIEVDVPVSKLEHITIKENIKNVETNPEMEVVLEAMSESGKLSKTDGTTTEKPVLTTVKSNNKGFDYIPINFDTIDDINSGLLSSSDKLETAGSEQKQHSRIQIKKGPNGQDYEYEYVYYYYDEDEDEKKDGKVKSSTTVAPVHNSHDGPQKAEADNQINKETKTKSKYSTIDRSSTTTTAAPENSNEVAPTPARPRQRGRTLAPAPVEEEVQEDRLPSSTRFPPRGRNLAASSSTTYVPEISSETIKSRGRSQSDSVADESIGQTRSRTRAHVRRPSSELVDLDSFKTHSGDIPSQYKEPLTRYSSESKTTTIVPEPTLREASSHAKDSPREGHSLSGAIRFQEIVDDLKLPAEYKVTTPSEPDTTEYTTMTAMDKVALDLYAYLARENLNNEVSDPVDFDGTTTTDSDVWTTEAISTTEEVPTTTASTTTTTSTTTAAPTTTVAASTRPSRFKGRAGARGRASTTSVATEAPQETSTRTRGRFSKPSIGRKTTAAAAATAGPSGASTSAPAASEKPAVAKQPFGRRGLFAGRTRPSSTTAAPAAQETSSSSEAPAPRPRLRPGLRRTTSTAAPAPAEEDNSAASSAAEPETTPAPGRPIGGRGRPNLRPAASLRPGPRLNLRANPRLRPGATTAAPEAASEAPAETSAPETSATEADSESSSASPAPEQSRGGLKLRNRLAVAPSPKPRTSTTQPPRRPNPLLRRKLPSTEATTEAPKRTSSETTEESISAEKVESETEEQLAETTAAPLRGLDALFARRRAAGGIGARVARPARGAPK